MLLAQVIVILMIPLADNGAARVSPIPVVIALAMAVFATWLVTGWRWGVPLLVMSIAAIVVGLAESDTGHQSRLIPGILLIAIYSVAAYAVARAAFGKSVRGIERIYCGIASFILITFAFAIVHDRIGFWSPTAYVINTSIEGDRPLHWTDFMWLSFSTITTSGFGDVTPVSSWARVVTSFEGLVGILYPATFIARLISLPADPARERGAAG